MFCDHFDFSKNFEFKTNSNLDIYKFRSPKFYMMKKFYKTEEEAYKIYEKKRKYNDILKSYNNDIKNYISKVRDSLYNSYYNNEYENIENLINWFYKKLEKLIDFIFDKRDTIPNFNIDLFCELLKLNSILSFTLGQQINSVNDIKNLNFYELAPSTMYILIYIIISKLDGIDIRELGFVPNYVENEALICINDERGKIFDLEVVPILDFINEIYYKLNKFKLSNDDVKDIFKKIMFGNHIIHTRESNKDIKNKIPEKNINYFCCNCLYVSYRHLLFDFRYRKLFYVENS